MKIICLIQDIGAGGAETQLCGLAVQLKERGHDVHVWTYIKDEFNLPVLEKGSVRYMCHKDSGIKLLRIPRFYYQFKKAKPDVVISYLNNPSNIACICKMLGCRYRLIVSHRNTTQSLTIRERVTFFLQKAADKIVPNSFSQGKFIKKNYPKLAHKTTVISNFTNTDFFSPINKTEKPSGVTQIATLARIAPQKNVLSYIIVISKIIHAGYKVHVDWYGEVPQPDYLAKCKALIKSCHIGENFVIHPATKTPKDVYQNADVFCLPSIYEGFPNVVCEAMSCGLPILCGRVCDNPYIVQEGINGILFDPKDEDDMVNKITQYLDLPKEQKSQMRKQNRDRINNLCSIKSFTEKYLGLIEKLYS